MPDHTTAELTPAERLLVQRRRLGHSQTAMANHMHVSVRSYRRMENGEVKVEGGLLRGYLLPHEWCYIQRKRAGMSRAQLAKALETSKLWVTQMEHGRVDGGRLQKYWDKR